MSYAITLEYPQEYFGSKIGRKIRIFSLGREKTAIFFKKNSNKTSVEKKDRRAKIDSIK